MVSDRPGDCPICGMRLVLIEKDAGDAPQSTPPSPTLRADAHAEEAHLPLDDESRRRSPTGRGRTRWAWTWSPRKWTTLRPAHGGGRRPRPVKISERRSASSSACAPPPSSGSRSSRTISTVGRVTYDETRLHHVHTKVAGWVERLYANTTGPARQGRGAAPLHLQPRARLFGTGVPDGPARARDARRIALCLGQTSGEQLVASARRRLLLFDLTPAADPRRCRNAAKRRPP